MENTYVGPFLILNKLGAHRRHNVFRARQVEQDREVALKFISIPPDVDWEKALGKINHEVKMLRHLKHDNLVAVYGAGVEGDKIFFAHELIEGEALSSFLARRNRLATDLVIDYGRQIAHLLEYLHDNEIIHSKLTTDKILIEPSGRIKVADLRLNRSRKRRWDSAKRAQLETAAYLAPEQLLENNSTVKSDLYSLGIILFEMLTGRMPYEPETMLQLTKAKQEKAPSVTARVMNCPAWLDRLIASLLDPDPKKRPHSAHAVVMTLEQIRKIDQTKKTAVEEMTRGFTALTAGADKTEARKLMGIKKEKQPRGPLLNSIPILLASLFAIAVLVSLFVFWPFNPKSMIEQAAVLMESENPRDWQRARVIYQRVMKSSSDPKQIMFAEDMYFEARRRSLMRRMQVGLVGLETPNVRKFYLAYHMQDEGDWDEALIRFDELVESTTDDADQRHIYEESKSRSEKLRDAKKQADEAKDQLASALDEVVKTADDANRDKAIETCQQIVRDYSDNQFLKPFVVRAKELLKLWGAPLDIAESSPPDSQEKGPDTPTVPEKDGRSDNGESSE